MVPVLAASAIDPGNGRIKIEVPFGLTIAEIIDQVMPERTIANEYLRVALVTKEGSQIVPPAVWHRARPHAGVHVVIRVIPGKDALRSILQIVVAVAAVALGQYWALSLGFVAGTTGYALASGLIGLGVTVVGNLLINALIPPVKPTSADREKQNRYAISGWRNRLELDGAVPVPLGTMRYAPPFAALSWSEIVGDWLYIRSLFNFGYGRLSIDDMRIGETSLAEYDEVEIEARDGVSGDAPISLFPRQVAEETIGAELVMPYPRDDLGNVVSGSSPIETPVTRTTGADASGASVIFAWPAGLFSTNKKGETQNAGVVVKIQQRLASADEDDDWQDVETLTIVASKLEAFYRQHTWDFPTRARWQIRVTMMTPETFDLQVQRRTSWAVLQTIRPEYPINFGEALALVALRIKATHQLQGQLDNFNAQVTRICLDYDHLSGTWIERETSNPASLYRYVLQSNANPRPVADAGIDIEQLEDWHNFCRIKGLKYDRVVDDAATSLSDILAEVTAAGRASKRHDGRKWGVVIDRPQELVVDHVNPRNSYGFSSRRSYVRPPDGLRVKFLDATNDYQSAERLVPWPGHTGSIVLTEALDLPGKTDPAEIFREATRRMFETIHRPDVHQASQDGPVRVATRGDLLMMNTDVLYRTQVSARVRSASGAIVEITDPVTMEKDQSYGIRFRVFTDEEDTIGASIVRLLVNNPGETSVLLLSSGGQLPAAGDIVHFGIAGTDSFPVVVNGIEAGEDFSVHYRLLDAAPIIDELTDALIIPAWNGRVGGEIDDSLLQPPAPRFTSISSGVSGAGEAGLITYLIVPGSGPIPTSKYVVEHRLVGAPTWQTITIPAANGGGDIPGYSNGNAVQIRAYAKSSTDINGPVSPTVAITVGAADLAIPIALDAGMITVGALLGGAVVQFATSADAATTQIQIYRSTGGVVDRTTDAVGEPILVELSRSYSQGVGDTTRENLLVNGNMDSGGTWALGTGWSISSGTANHSAGTGSAIGQPLAAQSGKFYRISFDLSTVTAGDLTPRLTGGSTRSGTARSANGSYVDRIQAVTGNNSFELAASSTFVGSVDNAVAYLETSTCLAQGTHNFWLEPQNDDGVPGPMAGPFSVTIR
jgi:hypothetical protein